MFNNILFWFGSFLFKRISVIKKDGKIYAVVMYNDAWFKKVLDKIVWNNNADGVVIGE